LKELYRQGGFVSTGENRVIASCLLTLLLCRFFVPQAAWSDFNVGERVKVNADGVAATIERAYFILPLS